MVGGFTALEHNVSCHSVCWKSYPVTPQLKLFFLVYIYIAILFSYFLNTDSVTDWFMVLLQCAAILLQHYMLRKYS